MSLELHLKTPIHHPYFYREKNRVSNNLEAIFKYSKDTQYVIDTCIITNVTNVLKAIIHNITENNKWKMLTNTSLKSSYFQLKGLNTMAQEGLILITPEVELECRNIKSYLKKYSRELSYVLKNSNCDNTEELDFLSKIKVIYGQLNRNLKSCVFQNMHLINDEILPEFKKSIFYVDEVHYNLSTKQVSDTDLGILLLAAYENTNSKDFKKTNIVTNDWDILAQGVQFVHGELLNSPTIIKPDVSRSAHGEPHSYFSEYKQPKTRTKNILNFLDGLSKKQREIQEKKKEQIIGPEQNFDKKLVLLKQKYK